MTLEELVVELSNKGVQLNNLFQLSNGTWRANVRRGDSFSEFGNADNPSDAIFAAIDKLPEPKQQSVFD